MPKKPKGGRRNTSWEKIKAEYVTDPGLSLKKVAEKYGVPLRTVAEHSKNENWFATKQEHQKQYCEELAAKLHQKKVDSLEQELMAALNFSDRILGVLQNDPEQFNRHLVVRTISDADGLETTTVEMQFDKLDMKSMRDAVAVLKTVEELKRSILGIQTIENLQRHQLERERFEFEKQKAEFLKPDSSNAIRIEGFEKGWDE